MSHVKHNLCLSFGRAAFFYVWAVFYLCVLKVDRINKELWNIPTCLNAFVLDLR